MKHLIVAGLVTVLAQIAHAEQKNPLTDSPTWEDLRIDLIGDVTPQDGAAVFEIDAPYRAHDAATVPIRITQSEAASPIRKAMLVIDENPAPMAAELAFSDAMAPLDFELRVRVNQYSNVRLIAETGEGTYMGGRFVKASGGCSAPASRDPELALADMGKMRLKTFDEAPKMSGQRREAQIMIRHPNYSGLQRDQITQLFISAHFIETLEVFQGDEMLFTLTGGISVSENPVFRFGYRDNGAQSIRVRAVDTEGNIFEQVLTKFADS
ncbi:MAG: quinoprotein dehydrogenase-associated SoxYZ-like carrier [Pseudomonadota bacterium]